MLHQCDSHIVVQSLALLFPICSFRIVAMVVVLGADADQKEAEPLYRRAGALCAASVCIRLGSRGRCLMTSLWLTRLVCGLGLCLSAMPVQASLIVVPNANSAADANSAIVAGVNVRYQQVYASSQFTGLGVLQITDLAFRVDSSFSSSFSPVTDHGVRVDLSTTLAAPNGLSHTFDNNVGA